MEPWSVCRSMVADSHHFDHEHKSEAFSGSALKWEEGSALSDACSHEDLPSSESVKSDVLWDWRVGIEECCGRIQILLITLILIRIRLFTLMRIRLLIKWWCLQPLTSHGSILSLQASIASLYCFRVSLHGSKVSLHGSTLRLHSSSILTLMRILIRIRLMTVLYGSRPGSVERIQRQFWQNFWVTLCHIMLWIRTLV
jgi:hypothetical protein